MSIFRYGNEKGTAGPSLHRETRMSKVLETYMSNALKQLKLG